VTGLGMPSSTLADRLLNEAGVSLLPGSAFGEYGEGFLRISFANSLSEIESALQRIEKFAERI
jgi:aspartate/methionine/tyrosine aminotransferase